MKRPDRGGGDCSVARTLSVIGQKWTPLIIRECYFGTRRFDAFEAALKIPRAVLAVRLKMLVKEVILVRRVDQNHARRFDYILTKKGWDLRPVLLSMMAWGDTYKAENTPPVLVKHNDCGHPICIEIRCPSCDMQVSPTEITSEWNEDYAPSQ